MKEWSLTSGHEHAATLCFRLRDLARSHELMRQTSLDLVKQLDRFMEMCKNLLNYEKEIGHVTESIKKFKREIEL